MAMTPELKKILQTARRANASDIHIIAGMPPIFRINGEILLAEVPPLRTEDTYRLCYQFMNDEQQKVFQQDWQLCCSHFEDQLGRFRVSIYLHAGNPEMSIRPISMNIRTREELRLPVTIEELTRLPNGLVLITGPTGSGKTTTMNYMIDLINSERRCKVITIEDPVEYVHTYKRAIIVQQELYSDVKSFSSALVHVLRQNPDVICIGEMRDFETTATALTAAETGHLVIATCHTPNTMQTVERIVSIFPPDQQNQVVTQLANSLRGIIAQRLVPGANRKERLLATEVLVMNMAARSLIRERDFHKLFSLIQTSQRLGMHTMDESLLKLYDAGDITYDTALSNAQDAQSLRSRIHENPTSVG